MSFLDLIFPKKCVGYRKFGDFICADCFSKIKFNDAYICPECLKSAVSGMTHPNCVKTYGLDGCISAVVYKNIVKRLIYQFKYEPNISKLSDTLGQFMTEGLSQNESFYNFCKKYNPVLVPIPLSAKKLKKRGYNHAELLTNYVAQYFSLKMDGKLLVRVKDTKPQYKLNKEERIKNIENAFKVQINPKIPNIPNIPNAVILVDDITTTFATLKEATKVLKHAGIRKVLGITLAREV